MYSKRYRTACFLLIIIPIIIFITTPRQRSPSFIQETTPPDPTTTDGRIDVPIETTVLLIYVYSQTHSQAYGNLKYFIDNAVRENDGVDYYFIFQGISIKTINKTEMPLLTTQNVHFIQHEDKCFDFGTIGWFLDTFTIGNPWINETAITNRATKLNIAQYKYFILMNSSIRGPFFPPYFLKFLSDYQQEFYKSFYWYHIFTRRINDNVKLVGCTISCMPLPHVQAYVLVTDFIGLKILLKPGAHGGSKEEGIFACHTKMEHVPQFSEVPVSNRIRNAGYMIDSVLTKYQEVNFNEEHNHACNNNRDPCIEFEGAPLEPYEVVFIQYNDIEYLQTSKERGKLYKRWMDDTNEQNRSIW